MPKRRINKVAVIGSGIMGSGIACHFANIGVEVLLLDIIPFEVNICCLCTVVQCTIWDNITVYFEHFRIK